jgi:hypothetical protein
MVTLRCTKRLLARLAEQHRDAPATGAFGDWYANPIRSGRRRLALCTNQNTLLSVVIPIAPAKSFVDRVRSAAQHRIRQVNAPAAALMGEIGALAEIDVGPTRSRSVLASMNQLGWGAEVWLAERPDGDLEELGQWLCHTPCSALRTHWPWHEAELLLTGTVSSPFVDIRPPRTPRS